MEIGTTGRADFSMPKTGDFRTVSPVLQNISSASTPVQTTQAVQQAGTAPGLEQVKQAVDSINQSMQSLARGLEFTVDKESERIVVKVVDPETREVIRQIPSEETLSIAKSLDQVLGRLIREVA